MSPLVYPDTTMDRIKTVVDGFVANSIRLRSSFLDREKTIREATATISAAPLTPEMASAVARYFSTIKAELGIVALKVESQFESNIALVENMAARLAGSQGRFARRQIERMRDQLKGALGDITRLRGDLREARERMLASSGWPASS